MTSINEAAGNHMSLEESRHINAVLSYIEEHLTSEVSPDRIAGQHFISLSQLYRSFYKYTGHSIKEYIRRRRISNACEKIKCSDMPLALIADESSCQTRQAFNKQFKSIVGMTPLEYRQGDTYFYFYPFDICGDISLAVKVGTEVIPECTITRFYDSCLIGIEDKAIASLDCIKGRVFGRNGKQIDNRFCYELLTERDGEGKSGLYATCTVNYNEPEINNGWNYLYNTWLSASMFEQSGDGYFEEYLFSSGKPRKLKLYLPVKKRKMAQHIVIAEQSEMTFLIARERGYNAERKASKKVMDFLQERHPLLVRSVRRFYVCGCGDICECGVECDARFTLPNESGLEILLFPAGRYAVLSDDCLGDIRIGSAKMDSWLANNAIAHESEPIFAIYETFNGQYDTDSIRMKLFRRLKNDKNG